MREVEDKKRKRSRLGTRENREIDRLRRERERKGQRRERRKGGLGWRARPRPSYDT